MHAGLKCTRSTGKGHQEVAAVNNPTRTGCTSCCVSWEEGCADSYSTTGRQFRPRSTRTCAVTPPGSWSYGHWGTVHNFDDLAVLPGSLRCISRRFCFSQRHGQVNIMRAKQPSSRKRVLGVEYAAFPGSTAFPLEPRANGEIDVAVTGLLRAQLSSGVTVINLVIIISRTIMCHSLYPISKRCLPFIS